MKNLLYLLVLMTACRSSEPGDVCETTDKLLEAPGAISSMGFSLADVVTAHAHLEGKLTWEPTSAEADYVPQGARSTIAFELSYAGSPIHENVVTAKHGVHEPADDDSCVSHVSTGLDVRVKSADGALDELVHAQAVSNGKNHLELIGWMDPARMAGSFTLKRPVEPRALFFSLTSVGGVTFGALTITKKLDGTSPQTGSDLGLRIAGWSD